MFWSGTSKSRPNSNVYRAPDADDWQELLKQFNDLANLIGQDVQEIYENEELLKIIGERIRTVRKVQKISQERLAELSGLHPTYISDIERGKVNASLYTFYMISMSTNIFI